MHSTVDMEQTVAVKDKVTKTLSGGVAGLLKSYGVKVFNGVGQLTADKKLLLMSKTTIDADSVILAGGSKSK